MSWILIKFALLFINGLIFFDRNVDSWDRRHNADRNTCTVTTDWISHLFCNIIIILELLYSLLIILRWYCNLLDSVFREGKQHHYEEYASFYKSVKTKKHLRMICVHIWILVTEAVISGLDKQSHPIETERCNFISLPISVLLAPKSSIISLWTDNII